MIEVRELERSRRNISAFIHFAWQIYRNDPNFVPPLIADQRKALMGINNALFDNGEQAFLMAWRDGKPVARVLVGTNEQLNRVKEYKQGYLSLFECVDDQAVADKLLDTAAKWLKDRGMDRVVGPENYTYDDFGKGLLVQGFDGPPVLFGTYNPPYYDKLFTGWGLQRQQDHYAFYISLNDFHPERYQKICDHAMERFGFHVDRLDLDHHFEREVKDITYVLSTGMPELLDQLAPPTEDDIRAEAKMLKSMADQELIYLARAGDRAIGFVMAMPDYNQIIRRMNGRTVSPAALGILKERLRAKGFPVAGAVVDGLRLIVMFVVPDFQNKAVTGAMALRVYQAAARKKYQWAEISTIDERNIYSVNSAVKSGARIYRVYRTYEKNI